VTMESMPWRLAAAGGLGVLGLLYFRQQKKGELTFASDSRPPGRVPIYVMMPLDWMTDDGCALTDATLLRSQLKLLKAAGVRGVMADVWWGLCEPQPGVYKFGAAKELCALLKDCGLELQAVMSFHKCGGNVGDAVNYPIPEWALKPAREKGLLYKSKAGVVSEDCLSLSADHVDIFPGPAGLRTPLKCYHDYIAMFASELGSYVGTVISEIQIGCGPCGELRYPSYMLSNGWEFPGTGLCMAYDTGMLKMLATETKLKAPPDGLPEKQNGLPEDAPAFKDAEGLFRSGDCKTFLEWQTRVLVNHGEDVLKAATSALESRSIPANALCFSVKVSGIHWHVTHPSRAAEACAGYDNCTSPEANAYCKIAAMLKRAEKNAKRPVLFNFTCLEMNNWSNGMPHALSAPECLISQVRLACIWHGVELAGENALEFDLATGGWAFDQMKKQLRGWSPGRDRMHGLTILRLNPNFVKPASLKQLREFIVSI